jgi:ferrous-iron efflux pump FieF
LDLDRLDSSTSVFLSQREKKLKTALFSIGASSFLIVLKLVFGFLTNSISIFASAIDSLFDLSASSVNYFSIKKAEKPADKEHRFGHGKAEGLAGLFQSFIIGLSSIYLIYVSVKRLVVGSQVHSLDIGILVMVFSAIVSFFISRHIKKVADYTDSVALSADSLHYRSDVYTNLGIVLGLIIVKITGLLFIDSLISICVSLYIIWSTTSVFKESVDILMDKELPKSTVKEIEDVILKYQPYVKGFHKMRTRRAGSKKFIEFHLVVDHTLSFVESHNIAEDIIKEIEKKIPNAEVTVHVDPHGFPDYS